MYRPLAVCRCAGESSSRLAAVRRRSAMACAYKNGLSVLPGWRSAVTPSTSAAWLNSPVEPTQASTSPLALSITTTAPSATLRPRSSRTWRCRVCRARRCSGPSSVLGSVGGGAPSGAAASRRRARCGATPSLGDQARRDRATSACISSATQSTPAPPARMVLSTPQARSATKAGRALGARTRAAAMAASLSCRPCGALANSVRLSASMPTSSPRNGTRLR